MNYPIQKIEIISPRQKSGELVETLQNQGCLEIISQSEGSEIEQAGDVDLEIANLRFALSFIQRFQPKEGFLKNIIYSFIPRFRKLSLTETRERAVSPQVLEVVKECSRIGEEINELKAQRDIYLAEKNIIINFLGTTINRANGLERTERFVGYLRPERRASFMTETEGKTCFMEEGEKGVALYYLSGDRGFFQDLLKRYEARSEDVFWFESPEKEVREREKKIEEIDIHRDILMKNIEKMMVRVGELKTALDWWTWEKEKREAAGQLPQTQRYIIVQGWVPADCYDQVVTAVEKVASDSVIRKLELAEGEMPPVMLKNKGLIGCFELVTSIYGMPKSDEPDPTPYLSFFFLLFFGIALSDSGYGILLIILSILAKKKFSGVDRFFNLFIMAGISTVIAGVLSGTFFGTEITAGYRLIDPVADPIGTLLFVMALGAIQISTGLTISLWWQIKHGQAEQALASKGSALFFFLGGAVAAITGNLVFLTMGLALMVVMNIVFSSGSIVGRLAGGFGSIYGLVGYFSDILSYSRLLALGLATGIIAMVINMIAVIFKDMINVPLLNWAIFAGVLVAGHIANLMINALGSYIHSARLQFVEFFSKFMEGGGRVFKPFCKKGRYIQIINQ